MYKSYFIYTLFRQKSYFIWKFSSGNTESDEIISDCFCLDRFNPTALQSDQPDDHPTQSDMSDNADQTTPISIFH